MQDLILRRKLQFREVAKHERSLESHEVIAECDSSLLSA